MKTASAPCLDANTHGISGGEPSLMEGSEEGARPPFIPGFSAGDGTSFTAREGAGGGGEGEIERERKREHMAPILVRAAGV